MQLTVQYSRLLMNNLVLLSPKLGEILITQNTYLTGIVSMPARTILETVALYPYFEDVS